MFEDPGSSLQSPPTAGRKLRKSWNSTKHLFSISVSQRRKMATRNGEVMQEPKPSPSPRDNPGTKNEIKTNHRIHTSDTQYKHRIYTGQRRHITIKTWAQSPDPHLQGERFMSNEAQFQVSLFLYLSYLTTLSVSVSKIATWSISPRNNCSGQQQQTLYTY